MNKLVPRAEINTVHSRVETLKDGLFLRLARVTSAFPQISPHSWAGVAALAILAVSTRHYGERRNPCGVSLNRFQLVKETLWTAVEPKRIKNALEVGPLARAASNVLQYLFTRNEIR